MRRCGGSRCVAGRGAGSRARKYRHLLPEALNVDHEELALLAVLMLRGSQTPGELKQRSERLYSFADLAAVQETLGRLLERELVVRHPRQPGQKEDRYEQVLGEAGGESPDQETEPAFLSPAVAADDDRLERLERELQDLRSEVAKLREALGG